MGQADRDASNLDHNPAIRPSEEHRGAFSADGVPFELQLLKQAIDRTEAIVQDETSALRRGEVIDLHEYSSRKSHQLLALNRAFEAARAASGQDILVSEIDRLRETLAENAALLRTRLDAVQEVAEMISSIMRQAQSDGTYSRPVSAGGNK